MNSFFRNKIIIVVFVFFACLSCKQKYPIVVSDKQPNEYLKCKYKDDYPGFEINYLGSRIDSIMLDNSYKTGKDTWVVSSDTTISLQYGFLLDNPPAPIKLKEPTNEDLEIIIDTTQIVAGPFDYIKSRGSLKTIYYKAYPVFIINTTQDTLTIPLHYDLLLLKIEALNKDSEWKPISYIPYIITNPEYYDDEREVLPPYQLIASVMFITQGDFKTKLRVTYKYKDIRIHSNIIDGYIYDNQFYMQGPNRSDPIHNIDD